MIPAHRDPYPRALAMVYHAGANGPHVVDVDAPYVGVFLHDEHGDDDRARHYYLTQREAERLARGLTDAAYRLADETQTVRDGIATICGECAKRPVTGVLAPRARRYRVVACPRHRGQGVVPC